MRKRRPAARLQSYDVTVVVRELLLALRVFFVALIGLKGRCGPFWVDYCNRDGDAGHAITHACVDGY